MTARELIELLQKIPGDTPVVYTSDREPDFYNITETGIIQAYYMNEYGYDSYRPTKEAIEVFLLT